MAQTENVTEEPTGIRIVVADDQPIIRDGFAAVLDAQPDMHVVARAADGVDLITAVQGHRPDLALVDIRMPRMDGITATSHISDRVTVLMLTTFGLEEYVRDALVAGASGFLLKDVSAPRLIEAVRLVASGSMVLIPSAHRRLVRGNAARTARLSAPLEEAGLTPREKDVFAHLARGASNADIATALFVSIETVKSHVAEILRKLDLRDRVAVVVYAHENDLVHAD